MYELHHAPRPSPARIPAALGAVSSAWEGPVGYSLRTALAGVVAMLICMWLQLDVPRWGVLTVIFVSPPTRGDVLRKSIARAVGTPIGCVAAVMLAGLFPQERFGYVLALGGWLGVCGFWATFRRGYVQYGATLAGFTAAIVGGDTASHPEMIFNIALDRGSATLIGVLAAMIVTTLVARSDDTPGDLAQRICARAMELFDWAVRHRDEHRPPEDAPFAAPVMDLQTSILNALAERPALVRVRDWLTGLPTALLEIQSATLAGDNDVSDLRRARLLLRAGVHADPAALIADADAMADRSPPVAAVLVGVASTLTLLPPTTRARPFARPAYVIDYWRATRNLFRPVLGMLAAFLIWDATAWSSGAALLTNIGVVMVIFVAFEDPSRPIEGFFLGSMLAVVVSLPTLFLILPLSNEPEWLSLVLGLMVALTAFFQTQPKTVGLAMGFGNAMLVILAPTNPQNYNLGASLNAAVALVVAVGVGATLSATVIPPPRGRTWVILVLRRMRRVIARTTPTHDVDERSRFQTKLYDDVRRICASGPDPGPRRAAVRLLLRGRAVIAGRIDVPAATA